MESGVSSSRARAESGSAREGGAATVLSVRDISKTYGVVKALSPASLDLMAGEVHALCGENGSGKSTLVGIASGTVKPDTGTVVIGGNTAARHNPAESQGHGALTVFQDGSVLPELTIAQNLYLGTPVEQRPRYGGVEQWATERLAEVGLGRLPVGDRAEILSPADRQLLEIVRAMLSKPKVLLLDEATSALDAAGVDRALDFMRQAATNGTAVLFVTHRLSEVFRVADRISVLRDGVWRGTHDAEAVNTQKLVEMMAGTSVDVEFPDRASPEQIGDVALSAKGLKGPKFGPVDLELRAGEIVGAAGADDNGQLELLRGLATVGAPEGRLELEGKPVANYSQAVDDGLVFLSGDRRTESLFGALAIRENLTVGSLGKLSSGGVLSWPREKRFVRSAVDDFGIRLGSPEHPIASLSGGNQQKVALARVLATEPKVVLIDEPTQGVDVRSRLDIYRLLRHYANKGLAVMIVSSDASELAGLCDRVLVCSRGKVVAEIPGAEASEENIVDAFAAGRDPDGVAPLARPTDEDPQRAAGETPDGQEAPQAVGARGFVRGHLDAVRLGALAVMILLLGGYAASQNDTFLTTQSIYNVLFLAMPLAAVAAAQFLVLFVGGIDISVGATMAVTVVLMSFFITEGPFVPDLLGSLAIAVLVGIVVGVVNSLLIEGAKISPVIATIATLGILQGVGLMLRPTAEGVISSSLIDGLSSKIWIFPWAILVLAAIFIAGDWALRSTGRGLRMRAVGLNPNFAYRLGVNAPRVRQLAYVLCAIVAAIGGVLLSAQVGVGDSTVGNGFTLLAIAAPVLGGASLLGGYGSFVGCLLGAVLLVLAQSLPTTLGISDAAGFLLTGGLTLLALLAYTSGPAATIRTSVRALRRRSSISSRT